MTAIKVNCGCGFTTTKIEDGEKHATETGHTLHLQGEIKSSTHGGNTRGQED